ncbi:peptidyl-glycine alpha-amidating monooxygenase B-like isoform X2 [Argopecten irradians]|uniref:peptidyl-glycine alpha-amidating monooxygenase B-like isoform X2 n=1 Tax=Argopecten irradians TaxID=31199 RepID=UPI003712A5DA
MLTYRAILTVSMVCGAVVARADDTGVYYKHLTLPLSTFVGENKVEYGCAAFPLEADEYITEYLPIGERDDVHHITVGMCDEPYSDSAIWECVDPNHVCKNTKRVFLYSWTNGAPGWTLPKDTGIYTGDRARYFILQVHGRDDISDRVAEFAHMRLKIRTNKPRMAAAISLYNINGYIPPHVDKFTVDTACEWNRTAPAPILAYGLHTHSKGVALSGYIVRRGQWIEIGRGNPLYPLVMFDVTYKGLVLYPGDIVATRCTFRNTGDTKVDIGYSHVQDMCNFFLYYGVNSNDIAGTKTLNCIGNTQDEGWQFDNIPSDASEPGGDTDQLKYIRKYNMTKSY